MVRRRLDFRKHSRYEAPSGSRRTASSVLLIVASFCSASSRDEPRRRRFIMAFSSWPRLASHLGDPALSAMVGYTWELDVYSGMKKTMQPRPRQIRTAHRRQPDMPTCWLPLQYHSRSGRRQMDRACIPVRQEKWRVRELRYELSETQLSVTL